jgi:peptide/nickel transport system permease protein
MLKIKFILIRIILSIATIIAGAAIVFFIMKAIPGDPALMALGEMASPESIAAFRAENNLDEPLFKQLLLWFGNIATGDLGKSLSLAGRVPIIELIANRLPNTLFIGIYSLFIAVSISLVMGTLGAIKRGKTMDTGATSLAALGISMPDFWLGFVLILVFSLKLKWLPSYGFTSPYESFRGALVSGLLPAVAISMPMAGVFSRMLRTSLIENTHRDFVTSGKALGFQPLFVGIHYIFRNSIIPYIVVIGLQARYLLGGVVVIEKVFGIPGLGTLMVSAAFARDYPVIQACTVVFLSIVMIVNLIVDILCAYLDPKKTM